MGKDSRLSLRLNVQLRKTKQPNISMNDLFAGAINTSPVEAPVYFPDDGVTTHIKWGVNDRLKPGQQQNPVAQRTFANSPHLFVEKWDTPILCIHGEKDFRILANQAMAAFDAAVMRGVPAELLIYPDENHWVLKPQNGVLWQRTFFEWLDKWLKAPAK